MAREEGFVLCGIEGLGDERVLGGLGVTIARLA